MEGQSLKNVLMITALLTMMFSAQMAHSSDVDMCIKHCVSRQCPKEVKKATPAMCEVGCKKLCNEKQFDHEQYVKPGGWICKTWPSVCA
ncbi:uncharacterized protein LOC17899778 [Capsella rubella]|uniref:uncharacterized protein LOC17899778 n=1 Tax=Capsella rubella TaxID=81985 RepID=UPI000CD59070|nr:uncharacterized protein LOC17899778 [Capsella rubella]